MGRARNTRTNSVSKNCMFTLIFLIPNQHHGVHSNVFFHSVTPIFLQQGNWILSSIIYLLLVYLPIYDQSLVIATIFFLTMSAHLIQCWLQYLVLGHAPFGLLGFRLPCLNINTLLNLPGVQNPIPAAPHVDSSSLCLGSDHMLSCTVLEHHPYLYRLSPHSSHPTQRSTSLCLNLTPPQSHPVFGHSPHLAYAQKLHTGEPFPPSLVLL